MNVQQLFKPKISHKNEHEKISIIINNFQIVLRTLKKKLFKEESSHNKLSNLFGNYFENNDENQTRNFSILEDPIFTFDVKYLFKRYSQYVRIPKLRTF